MSSEDAQAANTTSDDSAQLISSSKKSSVSEEKRPLVDEAALTKADAQDDDDKKETALPDDPELLKKEIAKLRRENAKKRVESREVEEAAQKWAEYVTSQKTELEKLQEKLDKAESDNAKLALAKAQSDLAKDYGVDDDLVEFITGSSLEEMTERAKKLASRSGTKKTTTTAEDLRAGQKTVSTKKDSGAELLKQLWNSK